jgi:hypothetical protein
MSRKEAVVRVIVVLALTFIATSSCTVAVYRYIDKFEKSLEKHYEWEVDLGKN